MGQSITFDFISRGAGRLAGDFKRTGDTAGAAARGAKVLQTVIGELGQKENRTAAESARLARALRLTGDAEDRAAAKALAADIAIRRLADAEGDAARKAGSARGGIAGLAGEVTGFGAAAGVANSEGSLFTKVLAGLNLATGVLEPALAGVVVVAGGVAAGFASAAAGVGVFGAVAKTVLTQATTAATATTTAQDAHATAVAKVTGQYRIAMSTAKTQAQKNAAYAAEQKGFQQAALTQQLAVNKATAGLSPPVQTLATEIIGLKAGWKAFTDAAAPGVVGVLSQGIGILSGHFGFLKPFLAPTEKALSGILAKLNTGLNSAGFKSFLDALAKNTGPAITKIATAIGNVVVGIGGILKAFLPTSQQMLTGIGKITAKFREWGTTLSSHSGFQSLMTTFRTETPQAVAILRNLGVVLVNVGKAMFGLSTFSNSKLLLQALLPLSGVMASLSKNTNLVRVALYALAAVKIGQQFSWVRDAWKGIVKFAAAAEGATVAETIAAAATKAWGLAMAALPWVALAAAVVAVAVLVIKYHTQIWRFTLRVWHDILAVIMAAWHWVKNNWPLLLGIIAGPIGIAALIVIKNWKAIEGAARAMWNTVAAGFRWLVDKILGVFSGIIHGAAAAFGWVPGLGGKLRGAASAFDRFRASVNRSLGGINGRTVHVGVAMTSSTNPFPGGISGRRAAGGRITGPGGPRDDRAGLYALSNNEWVIRANSAARYGHAAMSAVNEGRAVIGYAAGGSPGLNVVADTPSYKSVNDNLTGAVLKLAKAFAAASGGSGASVLAYAEQFRNRVPYVWGGATPSGWDCSGFVSYVYDHFRLLNGRQDAAGLQRWAKPTGPVPGGMAFYGTPAHHVGFVVNGNTLLSALGRRWGTIESALQMGDNSGYGIPPGGFGGAGGGGSTPRGKLQELAFSLLAQYGWAGQWGAFSSLENAEAGWNMTARNPSSGAYGLAQFINGPSEYFQYGGDPNTGLGQLTAMMNYIGQRWHNPAGAWANEAAHHWYANGTPSAAPGWAVVGERGPELVRFRGGEQVVPGYAAGGAVTTTGPTGGPAATAAYRARIGALERREGADYLGLRRAFLRGPGRYLNRPVYQELLKMHRLQGAEQVAYGHLKGAGLTKVNLDRLGAAARAEQRAALSAVLNRKHGGHPGWAAGLRYWLGQLSRVTGKGLPGGQLTSGPGGAGLPAITHTYGGDVTDTIGAFLSSVAAPFTGKLMDRGGWLKPGWNAPMYNATGRPEHLVPARGDGTIQLEVASGGGSDFEQFMATMIRKYVKVRGGGSVERAFGAR